MVPATQPPSSTTNTAPAAPSAEEEALKRNTDCVYFLASPLTCKKGSECEYRHSEYARINPKDCYYWLNGNCLNPKCGFRHPPLDGLLETQMAVPAGNSFPPQQTIAAPTAHAHYGAGKQAVPCIFFQGGFCAKGYRCAFSHGPSSSSNKTPLPTPASEPQSQKKPFGPLQKCTQDQKISQSNVSKAVGPLADAKAAPKVESALPHNSVAIERNLLPSANRNDEASRFIKATNVPFGSGNLIGRSTNRLHYSHVSDDHTYQNGKDVDELPRESSPGFDVLVDDDHRDSEYFHGDDQYGRARGHEGRDVNSVNEYDMGHSADYSSIADVDQEAFRNPRAYDSYDRIHGQHAWEQHRTSSERMSVGHPHLERRSYSKAESPDHISESDLRYRLTKQRRVNELRTVVSHEYVPDNCVEERSYIGSSRGESHRPSHESSIGGRLHGRIKLPVRSHISGSDLHTERETDRGRNWSRLSPGVPQRPSHQGRLRDRMKGRLEEDYNEGHLRGSSRSRGGIPNDSTYFSGPGSLLELRAAKNTDDKDNQSLGKRKHLMDHHQPSEGDLSFKGPMPFSEILKRKKQAEAAASGRAVSVNKEHDQNDKESSFSSSKMRSVLEMQSGQSVKKEETNNLVVNNKEEHESPEALNNEVAVGPSSQITNASELETEDGMIVDEGMEDREYEADEQGEGEYDYEQGDEGDYNYDEGENVEGEEEYLEGEEDDGDDFDKKIGVMLP